MTWVNSITEANRWLASLPVRCRITTAGRVLLAQRRLGNNGREPEGRSTALVDPSRIEPAHKRVYDLWAAARKANPDLGPDKEVHAWLIGQPAFAALLTTNGRVMSRETFLRYLRGARRLIKGPRPRTVHSEARSSVRRDGTRPDQEKADPA